MKIEVIAIQTCAFEILAWSHQPEIHILQFQAANNCNSYLICLQRFLNKYSATWK